jgi:polyphosphate kinase
MERFFDRDISWLAFNARVLQEAADPAVPLFERIRFMAIWSNNLDEFYRVRVATLRGIKHLGPDIRKMAEQPRHILRRIRAIVQEQQAQFGRLYREDILPALRKAGIVFPDIGELTADEVDQIRTIWLRDIKPNIRITTLDAAPPSPFLENRQLYFLVTDESREDLRLVQIVTGPSGRFITLDVAHDEMRVLFFDDVIRRFIGEVWAGARDCFAIKMSRDADLRIDDEYEGELIDKIRAALELRPLGPPVRLLYDSSMPARIRRHLRARLDLRRSEMMPGGRYHNFSDFFTFPFPTAKPELVFPPQPPVRHPDVDDLLGAVQREDLCLHFPYQAFDHVPQLIRQAMTTADLEEIGITIYRTSTGSPLMDLLAEAALRGVMVTVFIEAKARFDEANNLAWGKRMEAAGAQVIYSFPGIKVHAKLIRLSFLPGSGYRPVTIVSTGNFHEKTASTYTDYTLITCDAGIAQDARMVFDLLRRRILVPKPERLLVSPFNLRAGLQHLIDEQARLARDGRPAAIFLKLNNLQDTAMIEALYRAGQAGVQVRLLVRGICRLIPGREGLSEKIRVRSVVGRYLEHGRAYCFGEETVYTGSADLMTRNLDHRIEVLVPVLDPVVRAEILLDMETLWADPVKARVIDARLSNAYAFAGRDSSPDSHTRRYRHFQNLATPGAPKRANRLS